MADDVELDAEFDAFLGGIEEETDEGGMFDPATVVTVRSTAGGSYEIPIEEPTSIAAVLAAAALTVSQGIEYWVDGVSVDASFVVAPGATVTAIGMVKGGMVGGGR